MWNEYDKMTCGNVGLINEFKKEIESFFLWSDISYTMPGAKDEMAFRNSFIKKRFGKYYLIVNVSLRGLCCFQWKQASEMDCSVSAFCPLQPRNVMLVGQCSKFTSAVSKCWSFCKGILMFLSICLPKKNVEVIEFLGILKNNFFSRKKICIFV